MLTQEHQESINEIWRLFRSAGISNPLVCLENISYLILLRYMEVADQERAGLAVRMKGGARLRKELRWSELMRLEPLRRLTSFTEKVFPLLKTTKVLGPDFPAAMKGAVFGISKPTVFVGVTELIDGLFPEGAPLRHYGSVYEGHLAQLNLTGKHDQFRTPRHLIRAIVELTEPQLGDWIYDAAAGTGGFLIGAYLWMLKQQAPPTSWIVDAAGFWQNPTGFEWVAPRAMEGLLEGEHFSAQDVDATMTRIGLTNMLLHGIRRPAFRCQDFLKGGPAYRRKFDLILSDLPKHEAQFVSHCRASLKTDGRAALVVSDEFLYNEAQEFARLRQRLIEERILEAVVSLPSGVFMPYSSAKMTVLLINRGREAESVGFYEVTGDGFTLDKERRPDPERNDLQYVPQAFRMLTRGNPRKEQWSTTEGQRFASQCFHVNCAQIAKQNFSLVSGTYRLSSADGATLQSPRQILRQIRRLHEQAGRHLDRIEDMVKGGSGA